MNKSFILPVVAILVAIIMGVPDWFSFFDITRDNVGVIAYYIYRVGFGIIFSAVGFFCGWTAHKWYLSRNLPKIPSKKERKLAEEALIAEYSRLGHERKFLISGLYNRGAVRREVPTTDDAPIKDKFIEVSLVGTSNNGWNDIVEMDLYPEIRELFDRHRDLIISQ